MVDKQIQELQLELRNTLTKHEAAIERLSEIPGSRKTARCRSSRRSGRRRRFSRRRGSWRPGSGVSGPRRERGRVAVRPVPKGNRTMRRLLNQAAWGAVHTKGSYYQDKYNLLKPKLGAKKAIWAIAHKLAKVVWIVLHRNERYIEKGHGS